LLVYIVQLYVCVLFLVFKIMCSKPEDGQCDRNMWHLWTGLIKVVLANGSAYVRLQYDVPQRDEFHKKGGWGWVATSLLCLIMREKLILVCSDSCVYPHLLNKFTRLYETWREHYSTAHQLT
jgi:hypothetical protein